MAGTGTVFNAEIYIGFDQFYAGYLAVGTGTLTIGGNITNSAEGFIGFGSPSSDGRVVLASASAAWNVGTDLFIGHDGDGLLRIAGGATVNVNGGTGSATIAGQAGTTGVLVIGGASGEAATAAGVLNADTVSFGAGDGSILFNHTNGAYSFTADLVGQGTVMQAAGHTTLTGDSSGFTGTVDVGGGTLIVGGSLGATSVQVSSGGTLGGDGAISGHVEFGDGATLTGIQGETLELGSLSLDENSLVGVGLDAPGSTVPLFSVSGDLELDGLLSVTNLGDFDFGAYRLFSYGGALTDQGLTISALPAGFNPGDWSVSTDGGFVSLIVAQGQGRQYWDGTNLLANMLVDGGAGVWDGSSTNWTNGTGDVNAPWAAERAVFGGASGGTVTVVGSQATTGMAFEAEGYQLVAGAGGEIALTGDAATVTVNATATEIEAPLVGTAGLVKLGAGTLTLSGTNTYSGLTTVQTGTLALVGSIASSSGVDIKTGAALDLSGQADGLTTIGSLTGEGSLALGTSSLTFGTGQSTSFSGAITGTGDLTKQGAGTFTLSGAAANLGSLSVQQGTFSVAAANLVGDATAVSLSGGATLSLAGAETIGSLAGTGGTVTVATGTLTVAGSASTDFGGQISGAGLLRKTGSGTLTLSGDSTYAAGAGSVTNGTEVVRGSLVVDGGSISHSTSRTWVGTTAGQSGTLEIVDGSVVNRDAAVGTVSGATGTVEVEAGGSWSNAQLLVGSGGRGNLSVSDGGTVSASTNVIIGQNSGSVGSVAVTGAGSSLTSVGQIRVGNNGTGQLTISDGGIVRADTEGLGAGIEVRGNSAINIGAAATGAAAAAGILDTSFVNLANGGQLVLNHTATNLQLDAEINVARGTILALAGSTTLSNAITSGFSFSGGIDIVVNGGSLTLAGENFGYTGVTTLRSGVLELASASALGSGDAAGMQATLTVRDSGGIVGLGSGLSIDASMALNAATELRVVSGAATLTGALGGAGAITKSGAGTLVLQNGGGLSGPVAIAAGTLELTNTSAAGSGSIAFSTTAATSLRLHATSLSNLLTGFGSDDRIDLQFMSFVDGPVVASLVSDVLTVTQGSTSITLNLSGLSDDANARAVADSDGSTVIRVVYAPTDLVVVGGGSLVVDEAAVFGTVLGRVTAVDADSATFTYELTGSADGRFTIDASTGRITVAAGLLLDFEQATSHDITVRVTDEHGQIYVETVTVQVNNVNPESVTGDRTANILVGGSGADTFLGLGGDDDLSGRAGQDTLNGGLGRDVLDGGAGSDTYYVDNAADVVTEGAGAAAGTLDWVLASASYALGAGVAVERLGTTVVSGVSPIDLAGNDLAQRIDGNAGANLLEGNGGSDSLYGYGGADVLDGGEGNDRLDGGLGADTLTGGDGNDTYYVDNAGDVVNESAGATAGTLDRVLASASYALGAGVAVEQLRTTYTAGVAPIDLAGNDLAHAILGNAGANHLEGKGGSDSLYGYGGADVLDGGTGNDKLDGGSGADHFVFSSGMGRDVVTLFEDGVDLIDLNGGLTFGELTLSAIASGVRASITAAPTEWIDLRGVTLGDVTSADFM